MATLAVAGFRTLEDIHRTAMASLDPVIREYLEGGTGDESTLRRNRSAFDDFEFNQVVMSGRDHPRTSTTVLGIELALPLLTAPFGADGYFDPEGHRAVARANSRYGSVSMVPEAGTWSLEEVRRAAPEAALVGQLHPMGSANNFRSLLRRYEDAGYRAICVTCDSPTVGWREHNMVNGFNIDQSVVNGNYPTGSELDMVRALGQLYPHRERVWSWNELADEMAATSLPWVAKGVLTPADALAAERAGASAVLVSNHGGRQLDGAPAPIEVLPDIVEAMGGRVQVLLDSGIRRGTDVVKALALGADAVVLGRLAVYGLAAGGENGVGRVLELLREEIETTLVLLGRGDVTEIDASALRRRTR